jgi:hypothetical protein
MKIKCHVKWVPCQEGMARPQVAVGGDCIQIWTVADINFNKQSRTANREWHCYLEGWAGADNTLL